MIPTRHFRKKNLEVPIFPPQRYIVVLYNQCPLLDGIFFFTNNINELLNSISQADHRILSLIRRLIIYHAHKKNSGDPYAHISSIGLPRDPLHKARVGDHVFDALHFIHLTAHIFSFCIHQQKYFN